MLFLRSALALASLTLVASACRVRREDERPVDYRSAVEPLLQQRCATCHGAERAEGGYRADAYLGTIGCVDGNRPATLPAGAAPLLAVLDRPDHAGLLDESERRTLERWVALGTPLGTGVHGPAFLDPRSPASHGALLRAQRYRPLVDPADADRCSTCHEGVTAATPLQPAAGAPACTSCHTEGVFACSTCHGTPGAAFPPRDRCFFPGDAAGSHAAHVLPSDVRSEGVPCSTCHPTPREPGVFDGAHGDGVVEVWFDRNGVSPRGEHDAAGRCTGTCHDQGGARPTPRWNGEAPMTCNDCHGSPPAGHYAGACSTCHVDANAQGTALVSTTLHLNGRVDRGNGSGTCGSCHGSGSDPWPSSGAHRAHAAPVSAAPVPCNTCHVVPGPSDAHPRGGPAQIRFAGLALASSLRPTYDPATQTCAQTYCHTGRGGSLTAPQWSAGSRASACGACHAVPPPAPHVQSASCAGAGAGCHGRSTDASGAFTPSGAALHVDGRIDRGL